MLTNEAASALDLALEIYDHAYGRMLNNSYNLVSRWPEQGGAL